MSIDGKLKGDAPMDCYLFLSANGHSGVLDTRHARVLVESKSLPGSDTRRSFEELEADGGKGDYMILKPLTDSALDFTVVKLGKKF